MAVSEETASVLALSEGRLLTANHGGCCGASSREIVLRRYLSAGAPDPGFGEGGKAHLAPLPDSAVEALAPGQDGAIVLAAHSRSGGDCAFSICEGTPFLARVTAAGALDPSFGGDGWEALALRSGKRHFPARVPALAVAPTGEVYAAGETGEGEIGGTGNAFALARAADGTPLPSFGSGGLLEEQGTIPANTQTEAAVLEPDGETVVSAITDSGARESRHVLVYFRRDGSLNPSRGGGSGFVDVGELQEMAPAGAGGVYATRRSGVVRVGPNGRSDARYASPACHEASRRVRCCAGPACCSSQAPPGIGGWRSIDSIRGVGRIVPSAGTAWLSSVGEAPMESAPSPSTGEAASFFSGPARGTPLRSSACEPTAISTAASAATAPGSGCRATCCATPASRLFPEAAY